MVRLIAAMVVLLLLAPGVAQAKRVALVIGNAAYRDAPLANPVNDANDLVKRLEEFGFGVTRVTDATQRQMGQAISSFLRQVDDGDEVLVFYAGHGVQVRGVNWLMPVDANPADENEVNFQAISLDSLLRGLADKRPKVSLLMLDACRKNPFERRWRGGARGLARVEAASGTLISYAAKPGTTAGDSRHRNSPYTTAWLKALEQPGMPVEEILKRVHVEVLEETRGEQETWQEGQSVGRLVLNVNATVAALSSSQGNDALDPHRIELKFWESAEREDTVPGYEAYLAQYPTGDFVRLAHVKLNRLKASLPTPTVAGAPAVASVVMPPSAPSPAAIETALDLTLSGRREVQAWLKALGFDPGGLDGAFGPRTRSAISSWQASLSQSATGYLEPLQHALLGERGRAAVAAAVRPAPVVSPVSVPPVRPPVASPPVATPAVGTYPSAPVAGTRFRDCAACPEMVWLPPGTFMMGSPASEEGRFEWEGPQRRVQIGYSVAVGVHEVTFAEWDTCVSDGGCGGYRPDDQGWGRGSRPVMDVSWNDAGSYVSWLGRKTGKRYRLLSEAEWEYAARGGTTTARWWGEGIGSGMANCDGCGSRYDNRQTAPVGNFGANAFGLHDVLGNVWEWVGDCWNASYSGAPSEGSAWTSGDCGSRMARGGSFSANPRLIRAALRDWLDPGFRFINLGFRVARTD